MNKLTIKESDLTIYCKDGETILDIIQQNVLLSFGECAGTSTCGKCKIKLIEGELSEVSWNESELLTKEELDNGIRLSCQCSLLKDSTISLEKLSVITGKKISLDSWKDLINHTPEDGIGCAVDVGTTTVGVYLINLSSTEIIGQTSFLNPQIVFGRDVMSRLQAANDTEKKEQLHKYLLNQVKDQINQLCDNISIDIGLIKKVYFAGNTAMGHFLTGEDHSTLAVLPFRSPLETRGHIKFDSPFFKLNEECTNYYLAVPGGFVGSDILAGIFAAGLNKNTAPTLFIDLGTNGEVVLSYKTELFAAATAAGPAFEGAHLQCGTIAVPGAIYKSAYSNGKIAYRTIDSSDPTGICGSGILSLTRVLLENNILNSSGRLNIEDYNVRQGEFDEVLLFSSPEGKDIIYSQADVRELQLAKSAVATGIEFLLKECKLSVNDLEKIYITGAFGNKIDPEDIISIGLIPDIKLDKIEFIDNAAGRGTIMILLDNKLFNDAEKTALLIKTYNLGDSADFQDSFITNLELKPLKI